MLTPVAIIGAGGCARDTLDAIEAVNSDKLQYEVLGFIVDSQYGSPGTLVNDKPILGGFSWLEQNPDVRTVCGIGASDLRRYLARRGYQTGVRFVTIVHPTVVMARGTTAGEGTVILGGCSISNQVRIGDHVHISLHCTIGHDAILEHYVSMAPGVHVSGNVHLGEGANIGTGAVIIEKKQVGKWSVIGAGSTVIRDIPANTTAVGVPAHVIKERPEGWHEYAG